VIWKSIAVVVEGDPVTIEGANVWSLDWKSTGESIEVAHPSYPEQKHSARVYTVGETKFAACELSPGVWGFWISAST